jgi:multidrug resistance efflux pump
MLEFLLCSSLTILPDFLFRRFVQGKRIGREITLFSLWYELRWGITACVLLTITLITVIFYFHPATNSAVSFFRTVPVLPETVGRVAEVYVGLREEVEAGTPLFRLDSSEQQAAAESARRRIIEVDAALDVARIGLQVAEGRIAEARGAYDQAVEEYETRARLFARNRDAIPERDVEKAKTLVEARKGALDAALATKTSTEANGSFSHWTISPVSGFWTLTAWPQPASSSMLTMTTVAITVPLLHYRYSGSAHG